MAKFNKEGTGYEQFVAGVYRALLDRQGISNISQVQHNQVLDGESSTTHQVDVYFEVNRPDGSVTKYLIECKDYASNVPQEKGMALKGKLIDITDSRGILVASGGVQEGLVKYAAYHGIDLRVIRPPEDQDFKNRIREIRVSMRMCVPHVLEYLPVMDQAWIERETNLREGDSFSLQGWSDTIFIEDQASGFRKNFWELEQQLTALDAEDLEVRTQVFPHAGEWEQGFLHSPMLEKPYKIKQLGIKYQVRISTHDFSVGQQLAYAVMHDAINNTTVFFHEDGSLSGDVEDIREF